MKNATARRKFFEWRAIKAARATLSLNKKVADIMDELRDKSDQELIAMYLNGDIAGFDALYARYRAPLYSYLTRFFGGRSDRADDVFQQTWLKAVRCFERYRNDEKFFAWMARVAHNAAIDYIRAEKKRDSAMTLDEEAPLMDTKIPDPLTTLGREELTVEIERAVDRLNAEQKEAFLLRVNDVDFKEIANIQRCSINTALGRVRYALANLRKILTERGVS